MYDGEGLEMMINVMNAEEDMQAEMDECSTDDMCIDTWSRKHCINPCIAKENEKKKRKIQKKARKKEMKREKERKEGEWLANKAR